MRPTSPSACWRRPDSRDARLVDHLTGLINDVYAVAESGLWRDGATRTTASELAELIGAGADRGRHAARRDRRRRPHP